MFTIVKSCKKHGALTINDVYVRNTRKGMDCKFCDKEYKARDRLINHDKFKERGRIYRNIIVPETTISRLCSGCKKEIDKEFFAPSDWRLRHPYCKFCRSIANYKSKIKNKDTYESYRLRAAEISRKSYLKKAWNLTPAEYQLLVDAQQGKCAICKLDSKLHIDHNHETGKIRELLCNNCNRGLGYLKESVSILKSTIDYIIKHNGSP